MLLIAFLAITVGNQIGIDTLAEPLDRIKPVRASPARNVNEADASRYFATHFARKHDNSSFVIALDAETLNFHPPLLT